MLFSGRLESQAAENMALKQKAEGYRNEAGALESRLALIKAQRNKLLAAFEGFAGNSLYVCIYNLFKKRYICASTTVFVHASLDSFLVL